MQDDDIIAQLATVDLFSSLSKRELKRLAAGAHDVRHSDGHRIIDEGGRAVGFHFIVEGNAAVHRKDGSTVTLQPGQYFGEMSLIDGQPRSASVVADGPLRTLSIDSSTFNSLLDDHPEAARAVMKALTLRLRAMEEA